jgi:hypothetical protein
LRGRDESITKNGQPRQKCYRDLISRNRLGLVAHDSVIPSRQEVEIGGLQSSPRQKCKTISEK